MKNDILSVLYELASEKVAAILEAEVVPGAARPADKHHRVIGKMAIVDRVRGGNVQYRKKRSDVKGYKIQNGVVVKMDPMEVRKRKISGKISARKRRAEMAKILRKRKVSLKIRNARLSG